MADNTKLVNTLNINSADYRIAEHPYMYEYLPADGDTFLLNICEISTDAIYLNHVIVIDVLGRDKNPVRLRIKFANQNATDAPLDSFTIEGNGNPFYMKKMTSKTWVLWAECESWQRMSVIGFKCCDGVKNLITWNMSKTDISAKESFKTDWTQASAYYVPNAAYATSASRATNATNATSATKATQDGSGNVITSTYQKKIESITHNESDVNIDIADGTTLTIDAATTSNAGVMSKSDKAKLDGIAAGADATKMTWDCPVKVGEWSRICKITGYANLIIGVGLHQASQVVHTSIMINIAYNTCKVAQLSYNGYSSNCGVMVRITYDSATSHYLEVKNTHNPNEKEYVTLNCSMINFGYIASSGYSFTKYTQYTAYSGTYRADTEITLSDNIAVGFHADNVIKKISLSNTSNGYVKMCHIKSVGSWNNYPVSILLTKRNESSSTLLTLGFNSASTAAATTLKNFKHYNGDMKYYVVPLGSGEWDLYCETYTYNTTYINDCMHAPQHEITWDGTFVSSLPSGAIQASNGYDVEASKKKICGTVATYSDLPTDAVEGNIYQVIETGNIYMAKDADVYTITINNITHKMHVGDSIIASYDVGGSSVVSGLATLECDNFDNSRLVILGGSSNDTKYYLNTSNSVTPTAEYSWSNGSSFGSSKATVREWELLEKNDTKSIDVTTLFTASATGVTLYVGTDFIKKRMYFESGNEKRTVNVGYNGQAQGYTLWYDDFNAGHFSRLYVTCTHSNGIFTLTAKKASLTIV